MCLTLSAAELDNSCTWLTATSFAARRVSLHSHHIRLHRDYGFFVRFPASSYQAYLSLRSSAVLMFEGD